MGIGAYFGALYSPHKKQYQAVGSGHASGAEYRGPSESLSDISGIPGAAERAIANPPPASGEDHEKRDLAAQESMSVWAFWMMLVAVFSAVVTTIGTIFLYKQISLTREAVEDTGKATKAMEAQNDLAKDTARRQLRAYLGVTMCQIENVLPGKIARFKLQVTNHGQTPATEAAIASCSGLIAAEDFEMWRARFKHRPKPLGPLTPGDYREYGAEITDWVDADADMLISGKWIAVFAAVIVYRDVFGQRHFVACKAKLDPIRLAEGKAGLTALDRGNFAS
ncbi:MAG: hypothetical protein H2055_07535 [Sphingopyxis sp.]|nr:hypothetical protein [Sphingopyxis sp.]